MTLERLHLYRNQSIDLSLNPLTGFSNTVNTTEVDLDGKAVRTKRIIATSFKSIK